MKLGIINKNYMLILIVVISSVIPRYLTIAGHNLLSIFIPVLALLYIILKKGQITILKREPWLFIFVLARDAAYIANGELLTAAAFSLIIFFFYQVVSDYVVSKEKFISLLDCLINVSIILCLIGILEGITGINILLYLNNTGEIISRNEARLGLTRIIGFTTQASHYAIYCSLMVLLTLYRIQISASKRKQRLFFALGLQIVNLFFTGSRIVLLCFFFAILLLILKKGVKKFLFYTIIGLLALILILLIFNQTYIGQFILMFLSQLVPGLDKLLKSGAVATAEQNNMVGDRVRLYGWVLSSMKDHMLFGLGEKQRFAYEYVVNYGSASWTQTKESIEVNYMFLLFHFGLIGMISEIMMMIVYTFRNYMNSLKKKFVFIHEQINYYYYIFVSMILVLLAWFGIMEGEEVYVFYIILFSAIAYEKIDAGKKTDKK